MSIKQVNGDAKYGTSVHTMEYYSAVKKNKLRIHSTAWMNLKIIMLSEISQCRRVYTVWFHGYKILENTYSNKKWITSCLKLWTKIGMNHKGAQGNFGGVIKVCSFLTVVGTAVNGCSLPQVSYITVKKRCKIVLQRLTHWGPTRVFSCSVSPVHAPQLHSTKDSETEHRIPQGQAEGARQGMNRSA